MTKEELTRLDNYGHKELKSLSIAQLHGYLVLLEIRLKEVADQIWQLRKPTMKVR